MQIERGIVGLKEMRKPVANIAPFGLRMQPELKERVEAAARENNRSLNAEIVAALEEKFPEPIDLTSIQEVVKAWSPEIMRAPEGDIQDSLIKKANAELARLDARAYIDFYPDPRGRMRLGVTIFEPGETE